MDKRRLNKINKSFDQQYDDAFLNAQLPDLWGVISEGLEQAPTSEGHTIKDSFEGEHDDVSIEAALPTTLWATIAQGLHRSEGYTIKDSFEGGDSPELTNSIWYAVKEELEIESVWKNIQHFLDRRTQVYYWRDRLVQVSLVTLALLWIRGCYSDFRPIDPIQPVATTIAQPLAVHSMGTQLNDSHEAPSAIALAPQNTLSTMEPNVSALKGDEHSLNPSVVQQRFQTVPLASTLYSALKLGDKAVRKALPISQQPHKTSVATNEVFSTLPRATDNTTTIVEPALNNRPEQTQVLSHLSTPQPTPWGANWGTDLHSHTPVVGPWLAEIESETVAKEVLVEPVITPIKAKSTQTPIHRWEIGLEARLSNSLLWGETTKKAMKTTSMTSTEMQTLASLGMVLTWHWSHRDALLLAVHPSVNSQQYFRGYNNEGRYYWQQIRLTRAEATFSYQRTLWRGNLWHGQTSRLYVRALYHFSHLTRGEERINDELIETTSTYQRWQHSAGLALGISQKIHRWSIDVGANSTCGLSTMSQSGTPWCDSHLVTWGGYIGLRYHL